MATDLLMGGDGDAPSPLRELCGLAQQGIEVADEGDCGEERVARPFH